MGDVTAYFYNDWNDWKGKLMREEGTIAEVVSLRKRNRMGQACKGYCGPFIVHQL